jgi:HD-GYP domain-containing protein (c-di-GMP phosphodiesterase class II)
MNHVHDHEKDHGRAGHRRIKKALKYETRTILSAPLTTPRGDLVGVVQLLNKFPDGRSTVESPTEFLDFDDRDVRILEIVAGQAALAIENSMLLAEQEHLLEGFVNACVSAIESRDKVTSGHSHRVADYTVQLAEGVNREHHGELKPLKFSDGQLREIRFAALLHDIGKIAVKETILNKEKKLFPHELELIQMRMKMMRAQLRMYGRVNDVDVAPQLTRLNLAWEKIKVANEPSVLPEDVGSTIEDLLNFEVISDDGERLSALSQREAIRLTVRQGSLAPDERIEIERHVTATYEILKLVPWSRGLEEVAEIAYRHHEKLDGSGYPLKCAPVQIPVQSRMLTICDIYDALTADDRPYKKSLPVDTALEIIGNEVKAGKLDGRFFEVFRQLDLIENMRRLKAARKAA